MGWFLMLVIYLTPDPEISVLGQYFLAGRPERTHHVAEIIWISLSSSKNYRY